VLSPLALLTSVPYFAAIAAALRSCGHRDRDIVWIYGLNMVMLPVNAAGALKSLEQSSRGARSRSRALPRSATGPRRPRFSV